MKKILFILLLLISNALLSQSPKIDTIITTDAYKSFFNKDLKEPLYVKYILYHGGGDCSRKKLSFKTDKKINLQTATDEDYKKSGYDKGHLANSEDFAYDCRLDSLTFFYYNCLPQTANLNRGLWKQWEETIRKESAIDSLLVICGGRFGTDKNKPLRMGPNNIAIPDYCFKIVYSLKTKKVTHNLWFTNNEDGNTVVDLKGIQIFNKAYLGYIIDFKY